MFSTARLSSADSYFTYNPSYRWKVSKETLLVKLDDYATLECSYLLDAITFGGSKAEREILESLGKPRRSTRRKTKTGRIIKKTMIDLKLDPNYRPTKPNQFGVEKPVSLSVDRNYYIRFSADESEFIETQMEKYQATKAQVIRACLDRAMEVNSLEILKFKLNSNRKQPLYGVRCYQNQMDWIASFSSDYSVSIMSAFRKAIVYCRD